MQAHMFKERNTDGKKASAESSLGPKKSSELTEKAPGNGQIVPAWYSNLDEAY